MLASSSELPPISVNLPGANSVMSDIPPECSTSPSSLTADDEQLMQTIHYTHEGKSITFEIVNKRMSLTQLDSNVEKVDPVPSNIFGRVLNATFCYCIPLGIRHAKAKPLNTIGTT